MLYQQSSKSFAIVVFKHIYYGINNYYISAVHRQPEYVTSDFQSAITPDMMFTPLAANPQEQEFITPPPNSPSHFGVEAWSHSSAHSHDYQPPEGAVIPRSSSSHGLHALEASRQTSFPNSQQVTGHILRKKRNSSHLSLDDNLMKKAPDMNGDGLGRCHQEPCSCSSGCGLTNRRRYDLTATPEGDEAGPSQSGSWPLLMHTEHNSDEDDGYLDVVSSVSPTDAENQGNFYMDFLPPLTPTDHQNIPDGSHSMPTPPTVSVEIPGCESPILSNIPQEASFSQPGLVEPEDLSSREPLREEQEIIQESYLIDDNQGNNMEEVPLSRDHDSSPFQPMVSDSDSDIEVVKVVPSRK